LHKIIIITIINPKTPQLSLSQAQEVMIRELDLQTLWRELDEYNKELEKETQSLKEVWVKIAQLKEEAEKDATAYVMLTDDEHFVVYPFLIC